MQHADQVDGGVGAPQQVVEVVPADIGADDAHPRQHGQVGGPLGTAGGDDDAGAPAASWAIRWLPINPLPPNTTTLRSRMCSPYWFFVREPGTTLSVLR